MPNKIFVIMLDTPLNPQNIQKQIITKQNQKSKQMQQTTDFSKEASKASKSYAMSRINSGESRYHTVKLLSEGLSAKEHAKEIYLASFDKLRGIDGRNLLKEARNHGFNAIYDEHGNIKKAFEYKKRQGKKPDVLTVYEYENNELARAITVKDNGIYVSSITNYFGNNFEEMKFVTEAYRGSDIYEYKEGRYTDSGEFVSKQYKFSNRTFGQITEYRRGIKTNGNGIVTTDLVIKYDEKGNCKSAQENIMQNNSGATIIADPELTFETENKFYKMNFDN